MLRDSAMSMARVCSAVLRVLPAGVFMTTMPSRVAAVLSMLSVPTPARTMAFKPPVAGQRLGRDLHAAAEDGAVELGQRRPQGVARQTRAHLVFNAVGRVEEREALASQGVQDDDLGHGEMMDEGNEEVKHCCMALRAVQSHTIRPGCKPE